MIADDLSRIAMSSSLRDALSRAIELARRQSQLEVTLEHMLLSLCDDGEAGLVLAASNVDIARLKADATRYTDSLQLRAAPGQGMDPSVSADLRRIMEAAAAAARGGRRREINGAIVLAAIVGDGRTAAAQLLQAQGLTFDGAIRALQGAGVAGRARPADTEEILASARERVHSRNALVRRSPAQDEALPAPAAPEPPSSDAAEYMDVPLIEAPEAETALQEAPQPAQPKPASTTSDAAMLSSVGPETAEPFFEPVPKAPAPRQQARPAPPPLPRPPPLPAPGAGPTYFPPGAAAQPPSRPPAFPAGGGAARFPGAAPPSPSPAPFSPDAMSPFPPAGPFPSAPLPRHAPPPLPPKRVGGEAAPAPPPGPRWPAAGETYRPQGVGAGGPRPPQDDARFALRRGANEMSRPMGVGAGAPPPPAVPHQTGRPATPPPRSLAGRLDAARPRAEGRSDDAQTGQLVENIPRTMRVAVPLLVEARVARANVQALAENLQGGGAAHRHEVTVTKAMSVRLRAPDGGFFIETASPETQWIEKSSLVSSDDYASWRWHITPREKGRKRLQLIISARTVAADGLAAETALPDQVITVRVRANYVRSAAHWAGWGVAALAGGLLAKFGEGALDAGWRIASKLMSG